MIFAGRLRVLPSCPAGNGSSTRGTVARKRGRGGRGIPWDCVPRGDGALRGVYASRNFHIGVQSRLCRIVICNLHFFVKAFDPSIQVDLTTSQQQNVHNVYHNV